MRWIFSGQKFLNPPRDPGCAITSGEYVVCHSQKVTQDPSGLYTFRLCRTIGQMLLEIFWHLQSTPPQLRLERCELASVFFLGGGLVLFWILLRADVFFFKIRFDLGELSGNLLNDLQPKTI